MSEKFAAVTALTDAFCEKHLNDEYRALIQRVIGSLARKRPSPLLKGRESVWAAAAVHAIGRTNFLDDPSQAPHCKSSVIFEFFGVGESTVISKSKQVRETFGMGPLSPEWTLPSRLADNPLVWTLQVNGLMIDIRDAPVELQRLAYVHSCRARRRGFMSRISRQALATAIARVRAMDLTQKGAVGRPTLSLS